MIRKMIRNLMRNWKTSLPGLIGLAMAISSVWLPPQTAQKVQKTAMAVLASGLFTAKDCDK